jgi:hypothetical protein
MPPPPVVIPDEDIRSSDEQEHAKLVAAYKRKMAEIDAIPAMEARSPSGGGGELASSC